MADLERHLRADARAIHPEARPHPLESALRHIHRQKPIKTPWFAISGASAVVLAATLILVQSLDTPRPTVPEPAHTVSLARIMEAPPLPEPEMALREELGRVSADITRLQRMLPAWALPAAE